MIFGTEEHKKEIDKERDSPAEDPKNKVQHEERSNNNQRRIIKTVYITMCVDCIERLKKKNIKAQINQVNQKKRRVFANYY